MKHSAILALLAAFTVTEAAHADHKVDEFIDRDGDLVEVWELESGELQVWNEDAETIQGNYGSDVARERWRHDHDFDRATDYGRERERADREPYEPRGDWRY